MAGKSPSAVSTCPPMNLVNSSQVPEQFPFSSSLPWVSSLRLCSEVPGLQPLLSGGCCPTCKGMSVPRDACASPVNSKGCWEAPVTHAKIRDIYFMAVITALPEKECDLGDCGSCPFLVWICLLLSALTPFQWQCAECKLLISYGQTGCGCLENSTREMIEIQGDRRKNGLGQLHPGIFAPIHFWFCKVIYEKLSKQGETSLSPFCKGGYSTDKATWTGSWGNEVRWTRSGLVDYGLFKYL